MPWVERLAERPPASLPGAGNGWAETQAADRFLSQETFAWMDILDPPRPCTRERLATQPVVLCVQDTTERNVNGQALVLSEAEGIDGLGPRRVEAQRGRYLHPTDAITRAREPLGVVDAWRWAREPKAPDGTRPGIQESVRGGEGYARVADLAAALPQTRRVDLAERESDRFDRMVRARDLGNPADGRRRAQHHRALPEGDRWWDRVLASEPLGEIRFVLPAGRGRTAREVHQPLDAQRVTLSDGRRGILEATGVIAREPVPKDPPRLNEVMRLIARLGGFLGRKGDGEPGLKTLWLGMQRIMDFAAGVKYAREMPDTESCV